MVFVEQIASETKLRADQVRNTLALFDQGSTVPFITRYRKEVTGSLDENQIRLIEERYLYYKELTDRRETILKSIETQGKLSPELKAKIEATVSKTELEDLYLPYKPKRRTRAMAAKEAGLEPLARILAEAGRARRGPDPGAVGASLRERGTQRGRCRRGPAGRARYPGRRAFGRRRHPRPDPRDGPEDRPVYGQGPQGARRQAHQVRDVLQLQRKGQRPALPPHPGHAPRREGRSAQDRTGARGRQVLFRAGRQGDQVRFALQGGTGEDDQGQLRSPAQAFHRNGSAPGTSRTAPTARPSRCSRRTCATCCWRRRAGARW